MSGVCMGIKDCTNGKYIPNIMIIRLGIINTFIAFNIIAFSLRFTILLIYSLSLIELYSDPLIENLLSVEKRVSLPLDAIESLRDCPGGE